MRITLTVLIAALLGTGLLAYTLHLQVDRQEQLGADLSRQVDRLLDEIETATRQRLDSERTLARLNQELAEARARLQAADQQPSVTPARIDEALRIREAELRQRLEREYQQRLRATGGQADDGPAALIARLNTLNNEERLALFSVHGQYGAFLDSLDTSSARKEQITRALLDLNLSRARARDDLLSQGLPQQELAREMLALMGPEATREILAYDLTDDELTAFDEFQQQQGGTFVTTGVGGNGIFMLRSQGDNPGTVFQNGGDLVIDADGEPGQAQRVIIRSFTPAGPLP